MAESFHFMADSGDDQYGGLLLSWKESHPEMGILALMAEADATVFIPHLQSFCTGHGIPLVGAVFPSLLVQDHFRTRGCLLLRLDVMPFAAIYDARLDAALPAEVAEAMADSVLQRLDRPRQTTLFMLCDQMVVNISTMLDTLYLRLGDRVRYMGVNAGSESFQPIPCIFNNDSTLQGVVLMMLLADHPGAVVEHGYVAPETMISATATAGNRIIAIDWRPAFEVYRETVQAEYGVAIDRDNFYRFGVHFPFGIIRANGEIVVRIPVALEEDGSLFCVGEVPPNALLTLLRAPHVDSLATVEQLSHGLKTLSGTLPGDILTFYCAGRRAHLGDRAEHELEALQRRLAPGEVVGALSLGEIGHSIHWGYPLFHNGAIVCCRWGRS